MLTIMTTDNDTLYLVDGSGYIFRAYFALPQNLTNPEGTPVGAVLGFTNMLLKLLTDEHAPSIAVIFDAKRANFRNDIYPDYKANREDPPEDLIPQFGLIREATEAFDIPAIELEGYEADDLIATYARLAKEAGKQVVIVSSDKDLMQLVDDDVSMLDPMKQRKIGPAEVVEKFGVMPDKVVDVQALAGDSTDNVPGVPGIGIKTAAELINEYGDLEGLLSRAAEIKQPKRREKLIENADMARISRQLVRLAPDAPVPVALDDLKARDPHTPKLIEFVKKQGFKSVLARLENNGAGTPGGKPSDSSPTAQDNKKGLPAPKQNEYTLITDENTLKDWIAAAYESGVLAIDTETTGLTPARAELVGISMASALGKAAYIPIGHGVKTEAPTDLFAAPEPVDNAGDIKQIPLDKVIALLKPLLEDESVLKIGHNMKYDFQMFAAHGIRPAPCDDTMLLSYVLDGSAHGHGMDELSELLCGHTTIKYEEVCGKGKSQIGFAEVPMDKALDYAAEDAEITLRLWYVLKPRLAQEKMATIYEDIERPLIPVIADMERAGIRVDPAKLKELSSDFSKRLMTLEEDIHKIAGHPFNVGSPAQVGDVLFGDMGLDGGKKTKTGAWSTNAAILETLALQGHEIVQKILDWRQLSKLKSTYTDALPEQINPATGRIHTSFHLTGTNTGRLASSDPNLQNIPIRTEEGRKIREAFIAEPGCTLLSVDYSQVELRLAAALANVGALKEAFRNDVDIHALTASRVFGVPLENVTPELRRQAKAVNFGIIYGISGWGLAKQLGCEPADANAFIRTYLSQFNEIQDFMEAAKDEARKNGFVRTLYGRKCVIRGINDKNGAIRAAAERQAINAPLQGTAADIMKMAMVKMPDALKNAGLKARMLLQVHDELIFEVPHDELDKTATLVRDIMENVADVGVPLEAEAGHGDNWALAH
ncbi:MAG: DNA polymerase I [Rhodospirillales bacterium]|nr:DNA polymerase I [Rhodospirillales bacterium]